jgi:hypothetical protein
VTTTEPLSTPQGVSELHQNSDIDVGPLSQHHTLGKGNTQSSPGDHKHDGVSSNHIALTALSAPAGSSMGDLLVINQSLEVATIPHGASGMYLVTESTITPGQHYAATPGMLRPVRAVALTNVNTGTPGSLTADGVSMATGQRVLLVNQTAGAENGVWLYQGSGSPLVRDSDSNFDAVTFSGMQVNVQEGTLYGKTTWKLYTTGTITLGTTAQAWGICGSYIVQADTSGGSTTTSTTYANLADAVTTSVSLWMVVGQKCTVQVSARAHVAGGGSGHAGFGSWAVSGAETVAAADADSWQTLSIQDLTLTRPGSFASAALGTHTFTLQYKIVSDTLSATARRIIVSL